MSGFCPNGNSTVDLLGQKGQRIGLGVTGNPEARTISVGWMDVDSSESSSL